MSINKIESKIESKSYDYKRRDRRSIDTARRISPNGVFVFLTYALSSIFMVAFVILLVNIIFSL